MCNHIGDADVRLVTAVNRQLVLSRDRIAATPMGRRWNF
jgi:hypothetical protein